MVKKKLKLKRKKKITQINKKKKPQLIYTKEYIK